MTKIQKLEINDFRGFEGSRTLEFDDAEIVLFLGMNGFGKTSVFDSLEWCLTGHLSRYERYLEVGRKQDFIKEKEVLRNKYATDANTFVKLQLSNGKKFARRVSIEDGSSDYNTGSVVEGYEFGVKSISNQEIDPDLVYNYFAATHILSQETINHFVTSKRPEERYRALSVNFGTSLYDPFEENAQGLIAQLRAHEEKQEFRHEGHKKRILDLQAQVRVKVAQVEEQIKDANELLESLDSLTPNFKLGKYIFFDGRVTNKGMAKDDLTSLISLTRTTIEDLQINLSTIRSLIKDHEVWVASNKELRDLDKHVIKQKQILSKFKELQNNSILAQRELTLLAETTSKDSASLNNVRDIENNAPAFLEHTLTIAKEAKLIFERNAGVGETKAKISKATETALRCEQEIKSIDSKTGEVNALLLAIGEYLQNADAGIKKLEKIKADKQTASISISEAQEKKVAVDLIASSFDQNPESQDEEIKNTILQIFPHFDQKIFEELENNRNRRSAIISENQLFFERKTRLAKEHASKKDEMTKKSALLASAIELISQNEEDSHCPVCEVPHKTVNLIGSIRTRLDSTQSKQLDKIKVDISECEKEIERLRKEDTNLVNRLKELKIAVLAAFKEIVGTLEKSILSGTALQQSAMREIEKAETERQHFLARLSVELNSKVGEVASAIPLASTLLEGLRSKRDVLIKEFEGSRKAEIDFKRALEARLNDNRLSQELIDSLRSTEFLRAEKFLIENGFSADNTLLTQIKVLIEKLERAISEAKAKQASIGSRKSTIENELEAIRKEYSESAIEKELIKTASRIGEIGRLLSDFKDRADRIELDLGEISSQKLKKLERTFLASHEHSSKVVTLLTTLSEKVKEIEAFNKEDALRKKLSELEVESKAILAQVNRIHIAKTKVEDLKRSFPKTIEQYIKKNLDVELFNKIYHSLNPHRRFKDIDISVSVLHNRVGINFFAKQSKVTARPEFLFSSAQLNTFGVSMFLSMALRQNWLNLDTVLLDDPIQNLDDINILSFIDLIRGLLDLRSGKQVFLSTHDERFYNLVKRKFAEYKVKAYKFESYGRVTPDLLR